MTVVEPQLARSDRGAGEAAVPAAGARQAVRVRLGRATVVGIAGAGAVIALVLFPALESEVAKVATVALGCAAFGVGAISATAPLPTNAPNRSERALRALATGPFVAGLVSLSAHVFGARPGIGIRSLVTAVVLSALLLLVERVLDVPVTVAGQHDSGMATLPLACRTFKRALDLAVGSVLILLALPVMAASAVAVKCTSSGPWLFRQVRLGAGGRPFTLLKVRTMYQDNDPSEHAAYVRALISGRAHAEGGGVFKLGADRRITRAGRWLRRLSLDELPQLFNVLAGKMTLVGPRPAVPDEVAMYDERARLRLQAKPGMTGLWQVSGRSRLTFAQMVELDIRYWETWTPATDLRILACTPRAAFFARETA